MKYKFQRHTFSKSNHCAKKSLIRNTGRMEREEGRMSKGKEGTPGKCRNNIIANIILERQLRETAVYKNSGGRSKIHILKVS